MFGSSRSSCRTAATLAEARVLRRAAEPTVLPAQRADPRGPGRAARPLYIPLVDTNEKTDTWSYVASANALLDGGYSTPLQAGFYFVYPMAGSTSRALASRSRRGTSPTTGVPSARLPGVSRALRHRQGLPRRPRGAVIGHALLFGIGAYLLMLTVRRWWGEGVALLGGLLYAVDPWSKHYVALVLSETLAGTIAIALLYVFTRAWDTRPGRAGSAPVRWRARSPRARGVRVRTCAACARRAD